MELAGYNNTHIQKFNLKFCCKQNSAFNLKTYFLNSGMRFLASFSMFWLFELN